MEKETRRQGADQPNFPLLQETIQLKRKWKKKRQTQICKAVFWLKEHYFVYISCFALLFLVVVTFVFVITYHAIVTEDSPVVLRIFKAFIPAALFGSPLWLRKSLKRMEIRTSL